MSASFPQLRTHVAFIACGSVIDGLVLFGEEVTEVAYFVPLSCVEYIVWLDISMSDFLSVPYLTMSASQSTRRLEQEIHHFRLCKPLRVPNILPRTSLQALQYMVHSAIRALDL